MIPFPKTLSLTLASLALCSCDQIKTVASKVEQKALQVIDSSGKSDDPINRPLDPMLEKLIDRTEEGILFRKDLPFPTSVNIKLAVNETTTARIIRESQLGKDKLSISSATETSCQMSRTTDTFRFSDFQQIHHDPTVTTEDGQPKAIKNHPLSPPSPPKDFTMQLRDSIWTAKSRNFSDLSKARDIGPFIPELMQEYGLAPRAMWFGKRRIAPGKTIEISGELLPMLIVGKATGSLSITLQEIESVHGHPCARFSIKGAYTRPKTPSIEGRIYHEETTIQSGDIWLSVIHPVVLRTKLDQISKIIYEEGNGPSLLIQGNSQIDRIVEWQGN